MYVHKDGDTDIGNGGAKVGIYGIFSKRKIYPRLW